MTFTYSDSCFLHHWWQLLKRLSVAPQLLTKSAIRWHTSCDNNNNNFCRRHDYKLIRNCLCSWLSFLLVFVAFVTFVNYSFSMSQVFFSMRWTIGSRVLECLPKNLDTSISLVFRPTSTSIFCYILIFLTILMFLNFYTNRHYY